MSLLCSKIQKYSPTESAKVYDKAVNRKNNIYFHPRQTIDFISNNMAHASLTEDNKRRIVKQYLDVSHDPVSFDRFNISVVNKHVINGNGLLKGALFNSR